MSKKKIDEIVYCDSMICKDTSCLRNKANTPWGVLVKMAKFTTDKNGKCKDKMEK